MLRNPVDMLYAQHSEFLYNCNEDIVDFAAALDAEEERKREDTMDVAIVGVGLHPFGRFPGLSG